MNIFLKLIIIVLLGVLGVCLSLSMLTKGFGLVVASWGWVLLCIVGQFALGMLIKMVEGV